MSLGACQGSSGLDAGCNHRNGNNYQPHEWVGGVYFISDTQAHTSNAPLVGQIYICSATSSGGWGVGQAACCRPDAQTPLSATRTSQFGPINGYRTYYDCSACPPPPPSPPSQPTTTFDFSGGVDTGLGWSTGGGDPATFAFTSKTEGRTPSSYTGPLAGVGGPGPYVYAETSSPRAQGDLFTLTYDGSACSDIGLSVSTVTFHYHMYGATMGTLDVTNAAGDVVWSLSGDQGDAWQATTVDVYSPSFAFEYTRGSSYTGDAAVALVAVSLSLIHI